MTIERWLFDPTVGKIVVVLVGILAIRLIWGMVQRALTSQVRDSSARYQLRKFITLAAYLLGGLLITLVYSDQLGSLTVAFGVAGAGIAFALQEVIVSLSRSNLHGLGAAGAVISWTQP